MKKFKLEDLEIESFATSVIDEEVARKIYGGNVTVTCKEDPATNERNVSSCTIACGPKPPATN